MGRPERAETVIGGENISERPAFLTKGIDRDKRSRWRHRRRWRKSHRQGRGRGERSGHGAAEGLKARTAAWETRGWRARRAASAEGSSIENRGTKERKVDRGGRRCRGSDRCLGRRNERRLVGSYSPSDFGDGGAFKLTVCSPILEGGMSTWREERSGLEVASEGGKKTRLGETYHTAEAEVGIEEVPADQVFTGVGGMRTV